MTVDVLVVGGGPAGSSCAWKLCQAGVDVVVMDRAEFPRDKLCAGWITPQLVAALDLDLKDYRSRGLTLQELYGFRVGRFGDRSVRVDYPRPVSYGIRRCEFDDYLLRRSGARLRLGEPLECMERSARGWLINGELRARVLIGAGGHFCPVARFAGASLGSAEPVVAAQEAEFRLTREQQAASTVEPSIPELYFTRDLRGYGWVFRKGEYVNVGLGRLGNEKLASHVGEFVTAMQAARKIPAERPRLKGHPYLLYDLARRPLTGEGLLLIGDAAGLAYPYSGEGIRPAVESGLLAAETLLEAKLRFDASVSARYEQRVFARFGKRRVLPGLTDLFPPAVAGAVGGWFLGNPWFARHVVLDRWFFHARQPVLTGALMRPAGAPA